MLAQQGTGADFFASCPKRSRHGVTSEPIGIVISKNPSHIMGSASASQQRSLRQLEKAIGLKTKQSETAGGTGGEFLLPENVKCFRQ